MSQSEASQRIDLIKRFIIQEAQEQIREIQTRQERDAQLERTRITSQLSKEMDERDADRRAQFELQQRVHLVQAQSESRLQWLRARDKAVRSIFALTRYKLQKATEDTGRYRALLTELIAQGIFTLQCSKVLLQVRAADIALARSLFEDVSKRVSKMRGSSIRLALRVDEENPLPPAPASADASLENTCAGGVVVIADGPLKERLRTVNTLDARLSIAFEDQLPFIRSMVFGIEDKSAARIPDEPEPPSEE